MLSTTNGKLSIVELTSPFERLAIQFFPEKIEETRRIEIAETRGVVGWNHTGSHYTGGDDIVGFTVLFHSDDTTRQAAIKAFRWLQSLGQSNRGRQGQPTVAIVFAGLYQNKRFSLIECSGSLSSFYSSAGGKPTIAEVNLKFKREAPRNPTPFSDKRK